MFDDPGHFAPVTKRVLSFQPQRRGASAALLQAVANLAAELEELALRTNLTKRGRSQREKQDLLESLEAIVCNLLRPELIDQNCHLAIPLATAVQQQLRRYRPRAYGSQFLALLGGAKNRNGLLYRAGFAEICEVGYNVKEFGRSTPTTIRATSAFLERFAAFGPDSINRFVELPEVIALKDENKRLIDYEETVETHRMRSEMREINAQIEQASISLLNDITKTVSRMEDRSLRRVFSNGDWAQGGRLHGACWITMERAARLERVRIADEKICNVDWSSLHLTLAYNDAGVEPPSGDLYAIDGIENRPDQREAIKRVIAALLNAKKALRSWPGQTIEERRALSSAFPSTLTFTKLKDAIIRKHQPVAALFEKGAGLRYQRIESDMLVKVLIRLSKMGIVALPLHDSVLVGASNASSAQQVMSEVSRETTGRTLETKTQSASD